MEDAAVNAEAKAASEWLLELFDRYTDRVDTADTMRMGDGHVVEIEIIRYHPRFHYYRMTGGHVVRNLMFAIKTDDAEPPANSERTDDHIVIMDEVVSAWAAENLRAQNSAGSWDVGE
jgi:phosphatidylglycerophosphatase A